ncbi:MAG: hypothetical protein KAR33_03410 [Candidatus Thorarchaeota archaeon]|nr:hypothetical protein [Candidatus Thorarchaeota archaeon]
MRTIGKANGVGIAIPDDAYFSFFNSPYIGHRNCSSVDVYPSHNEWAGPAFSPVKGTVVKLKQIRMGKKRKFETKEYDYAIGIQPDDNEESILRILHCDPTVKIGDEVAPGAEIGSLLRSRYFNFWTGPHYHIDVVNSKYFERSSKSHPIEKAADLLDSPSVDGHDYITQAQWIIQRITSDYILATSSTSMSGRIDSVFGHVAQTDSGNKGLLDAGIPHYPHGGIYGVNIESGSIMIGDSAIGYMKMHSPLTSFFTQNKQYSMFLDNSPIRGISMYIYSKSQLISNVPPLKIIPIQFKGFEQQWSEGDSVNLSLRRPE